jgi:cytochrome c553
VELIEVSAQQALAKAEEAVAKEASVVAMCTVCHEVAMALL